MQCPVCVETQLVLSERQGIEIDYCPRCRGVWLDRGELDKLIERSAALAAPTPDRGAYQQERDAYPQERPREDHRDDRYDDRRRKKRRGFLDDIFDFD